MAGIWKDVPKEVAVNHKLYGISGWSSILLNVQIFGPFLTVLLAVAVKQGSYKITGGTINPADTQVLISEIGLGLWSWLNAYLLFQKNRFFFILFWIRAVCLVGFGLITIFGYYFPLAYVGESYAGFAMMLLLVRVPSAVFWSLYLLYSESLHVTLEHKVWQSDASSGSP